MRRVHELRRFVDKVMTCTGQLGHVEEIFDEDTGQYEDTFAATWTGPCLVYPADRDARVVEVGGGTWPISRYVAILPAGTDVRIGQLLNLTESPDAPGMVGAVFRITDAPVDAWEVARHCMAERVESGVWS